MQAPIMSMLRSEAKDGMGDNYTKLYGNVEGENDVPCQRTWVRLPF